MWYTASGWSSQERKFGDALLQSCGRSETKKSQTNKSHDTHFCIIAMLHTVPINLYCMSHTVQ